MNKGVKSEGESVKWSEWMEARLQSGTNQFNETSTQYVTLL